jgi:hypothetical protein
MRVRTGNNPKRRIISGVLPETGIREKLAAVVKYTGSGHHKRNPADYGLERTNPRPTKSLCDAAGSLPLSVALGLLREGVLKAMISAPAEDGFPKYIGSVSPEGVVYEAKTHPNTPGEYHGYPLENEDDMRAYVMKIWVDRCSAPGK